MAHITNTTYLVRKAASAQAFTKLCDIFSYPDMKGQPETIEVTTLSRKKRKAYINGLQDGGEAMEFGVYYEKATYEALYAIEQADAAITDPADLATYQLWFGEEGVNGKFEWQGKLTTGIPGGEPNAAREMRIYITDEGEDELHYVTS